MRPTLQGEKVAAYRIPTPPEPKEFVYLGMKYGHFYGATFTFDAGAIYLRGNRHLTKLEKK